MTIVRKMIHVNHNMAHLGIHNVFKSVKIDKTTFFRSDIMKTANSFYGIKKKEVKNES